MRYAVWIAAIVMCNVAAGEGQLPADTRTIKHLTVKQAEELAQREMVLDLSGLTTLSADAAQALSQHKGGLWLNGLTKLSAPVAKALARHKGYLHLDGVTTLTDDAARGLAQHEDTLYLFGLTTLSQAQVQALAESKGSLYIGLTTLSEEAANAFALHQGGLGFNRLTTLSDDAARALARHQGGLSLNGLTSLSAEVAEALTQHTYPLFLDGLTTLSDEAAGALAERKDGVAILSLSGLTSLSAEAAKSLSQRRGPLFLRRLTTLSDEAAQALAQHKGRLILSGLTTISEEAARMLRANANIELPESLNTKGLPTMAGVGADTPALASTPQTQSRAGGEWILADGQKFRGTFEYTATNPSTGQVEYKFRDEAGSWRTLTRAQVGEETASRIRDEQRGRAGGVGQAKAMAGATPQLGAVGTVENIPNGFRGFPWGSPMTFDFNPAGGGGFERVQDDLSCAGTRAKRIRYNFKKGLSSVTIEFDSNVISVKASLERQFGPGGGLGGRGPDICLWENKHTMVTLVFNKGTGVGVLMFLDKSQTE